MLLCARRRVHVCNKYAHQLFKTYFEYLKTHLPANQVPAYEHVIKYLALTLCVAPCLRQNTFRGPTVGRGRRGRDFKLLFKETKAAALEWMALQKFRLACGYWYQWSKIKTVIILFNTAWKFFRAHTSWSELSNEQSMFPVTNHFIQPTGNFRNNNRIVCVVRINIRSAYTFLACNKYTRHYRILVT